MDKLAWWFGRWLGVSRAAWIIERLARVSRVKLLDLAHQQLGIMKYHDFKESGEEHLILNVLPNLVRDESPVMLDVGANIGDFSKALREAYPDAFIVAFEPASETFSTLARELDGLQVECVNLALGATNTETEIYLPKNATNSGHASLYREATLSLHKKGGVRKEKIKMETLDSFTARKGIERIDFLKIDTEGHEYNVLQGAEKLLKEDRIRSIMFEFNAMNVVSRCFLRDFYNILPGFHFFRLDTHRLIPLGGYTSRNEIFLFQNILAVHTSALPSGGLR